MAALALCRTIMENGNAELCRLAMEFQAQGEEDFLAPALAARLIAQSPADSYDWAEKQLLRTGLLGTKVRQEAIRPFRYVLGTLHWDPVRGACGGRRTGPALEHRPARRLFRHWIRGGFPCCPEPAADWTGFC